MNLSNEFAIEGGHDEIWTTMLDIRRVARCVPGAEVVGVTDDGAYQANVKIKVGPMAMTYRGTLRVAEQDDRAHRAVLVANARDIRGQGSATADMVMQLVGGEPRTTVRVDTTLQVTGRVAQMGRGVMQDVANGIMRDFSSNLQQLIAAERAAPTAANHQTPSADRQMPETREGDHGESVDAAAAEPSASASTGSELGAMRLVVTVLRGRVAALLRALADRLERGSR